jgi:hypothetical protein
MAPAMHAAVRAMVLDAYLIGLRCSLPAAIRALPLPAVLRLVASRKTSAAAPPRRAYEAIARSERVARRLRAPDTCLFRSIVRFAGLRAAGLPATFVMAVCVDDPETGHAWVEIDGVPSGEPLDTRYVPTFRFAG